MDDYSCEDEKLVVIRHPKKIYSHSGAARLKEFIHPDDITTPFL